MRRGTAFTGVVAARGFGWPPRACLGALSWPRRPAHCAHAEARPARRHWMAVTGKPLAATAGAKIFEQGGNAVDAACAMIAATSTMWDTLSWGGETQALIYNPSTGKVIGINGLGVAPTGATPEYFHKLGMQFPPEYGPLAAVTPGTPGGLMTMLAEYGTMSLSQVLAPAIEMADGYPMEACSSTPSRTTRAAQEWPDSQARDAAAPGRGARGTGTGRDLPSARSRGHAAQARRGGEARRSRPARTAKRRSTPPTTASTGATSRGVRARRCAKRAASSRSRISPTGR